MKRSVRRGLMILLALVFLGSGLMMLRQALHYRAAEQAYDLAEALAMGESAAPPSSSETLAEPSVPLTSEPVREEPEPSSEPPQETPAPSEQPTPEPTPTPKPLSTEEFLRSLNLNALRSVNGEVVGWIYIPGTAVSYPLLQTTDNEKYLNAAWNGTRSSVGSIFLEHRSSTDLSDFNTIVYGHYMRNNTMFACLLDYQSQRFYENHPEIWLVTDGGAYRYEVFASYEAPVDSDTYRLLFEDEQEKQSALDYYLDSSVIATGLVPTAEDHLLTLSTCTGNGTYDTRWVVQAVLTEQVVQ